MTELLDAVDELTLPQKHREQQDVIQDGHVVGQQRVTIEHAPLLTQLDEAIKGAVGAGSSKGSLAFERNLLDLAALHRFIQIQETISQWCVLRGVTPTREPRRDLRAWYTATLATTLEEASERFYLDQLTKWIREIHATLDPWREREIVGEACPLCESTDYFRDGDRYLHPLIVKYKATGADLIQQARGFCRSCAAVWRVRELAWLIEQRHEQQQDQETAA